MNRRVDVYFALRFDCKLLFLARYLDFCTRIWHIVGKDGFKWTKTDRDRQGQTRTREREKLENIGSIWQRKNKRKLGVCFWKSEDTNLRKSLERLQFLKIWNLKFEI